MCYPYRPILAPDPLTLAVTISPHGLIATLSSAASLSQELSQELNTLVELNTPFPRLGRIPIAEYRVTSPLLRDKYVSDFVSQPLEKGYFSATNHKCPFH